MKKGGCCATTHDVCSICQELPFELDAVTKLECKHLFHTACLDGLLDVRCPLCRGASAILASDTTRMEKIMGEVVEKKMKTEKEDRTYAEELQKQIYEEREQMRRERRREVEAVAIPRGGEEWMAAVETIIATLSDTIGTDNYPLLEMEGKSMDKKKEAVHQLLHERSIFLNITCADLREIAGEALAHEMFGGE